MSRRVEGFEAFQTGALTFMSGVLFTLAMKGSPGQFTREDLGRLAACIAFAIYGGVNLRRLYRAQRTDEADSSPAQLPDRT